MYIQEILAQATVKSQLQNQEYYTLLHKTLRDLEGHKKTLLQELDTPIKDTQYRELEELLRENFERIETLLKRYIEKQMEKITNATDSLVEAKRLLTQY